MKIIDSKNNVIETVDLEKGYIIDDRLLVKHHKAVKAVAGEGHYETIAEYQNGGKDVEWVWDIVPVEAAAAWDEYEDVQRYVEYTPEELAEKNKPQPPTLEELAAENKRLSAQLQASIDSNAMLEDCLAEMAEIVYA